MTGPCAVVEVQLFKGQAEEGREGKIICFVKTKMGVRRREEMGGDVGGPDSRQSAGRRGGECGRERQPKQDCFRRGGTAARAGQGFIHSGRLAGNEETSSLPALTPSHIIYIELQKFATDE